MGLYARQAWLWAGGDLWAFARLIKLPGLAGEALALWALWRFAGRRAFVVYACLPSAILISGFHGNTDCLYAALVLAAAIAFDKERYFLSGVLWASALNVKLLPLALIPIAVLNLPGRRAFQRFVAGIALGGIPFIPPALAAAGAMYRNMVAYNSRPDNWGIVALLNRGVDSPALRPIIEPIREWWLTVGRYLILLSTTGVALLSRFRGRVPMTQQAALGAALFLVLTPGFGVQYVAFATPLLCMADWRTGAWWGWTSGLFIGAVYGTFLVSWMPLQSVLWGMFPLGASALGMPAWAVLAHFVWKTARSAWAPSASPKAAVKAQ
jgi:hypothetical protein